MKLPINKYGTVEFAKNLQIFCVRDDGPSILLEIDSIIEAFYIELNVRKKKKEKAHIIQVKPYYETSCQNWLKSRSTFVKISFSEILIQNHVSNPLKISFMSVFAKTSKTEHALKIHVILYVLIWL